MATQQIVETVKGYLHKLEERGIPVAFGILYGSYARYDSHTHSDVDLMVVTSRFDEPNSWNGTEILWETTVHTDSRIEPIGVGIKQWEEDESTPLIDMARQQRQIIRLETTT
ncbi:MAG: nucleotidyltransferase domain-containing protein [Magnetococcales bacterium]|nr:nucleotidyltransferase domain-containing protein [Magnetococcales bacterium]